MTDAADAPSWQLRVGVDRDPASPRETLAVRLGRGGVWGAESYRASVVDARGRRYAGDGGGALAALWRLVEKLNARGRPVWHVAPPGEAVPEDGRPTPDTPREPIQPGELRRLKDAKVVPAAVRSLVQRVVLAGAGLGLTDIYEGSTRSVAVQVKGPATERFAEELRAHGFRRGRRHGVVRWQGHWPPSAEPPRPPSTRRRGA